MDGVLIYLELYESHYICVYYVHTCTQFQVDAVNTFCSKYSPDSNRRMGAIYYRHILTDSSHKVLLCYLPKNGCTNLKLLFYVNQGLLSPAELEKPRDQVDQDYLMTLVYDNSLLRLDDETRQKYMTTFFKFVMVRHPLERLVSAFRSKIERYNLTGMQRNTPHYNWARLAILKSIHPKFYDKWIRTGMRPIPISFSDFIDYWLQPTDTGFEFDDHFRSLLLICRPCTTRFDFYGNFRNFKQDAQVLIHKIKADSSDLRQGYYSEESSTEQQVTHYYSTLSSRQKRDIIRKLSLELEFHYTIFPEERDSHKKMMDIDMELDLPSR